MIVMKLKAWRALGAAAVFTLGAAACVPPTASTTPAASDATVSGEHGEGGESGGEHGESGERGEGGNSGPS